MYVVLRADVGLAAATTDGTVSDVWCVISWSLQTVSCRWSRLPSLDLAIPLD